MKLPHLTTGGKAQLWGLLVGAALAVLACERAELSYGIMAIIGAAAWVASERWLQPRLMGDDMRVVALGVASGLLFPWVGVLAAFLLQQLRP